MPTDDDIRRAPSAPRFQSHWNLPTPPATLARNEDPYQYIYDNIAPGVLEAFMEKSADYPVDGFRFLGIRGQVSDIIRKVFKIKSALWDGNKLQGEQPKEIIEDLIGHCYLALLLLEEGNGAQD